MQEFEDANMSLTIYNSHCHAIRQLERACKNLSDLVPMTNLYHYEEEINRLIAIVEEAKEKYCILRREFLNP